MISVWAVYSNCKHVDFSLNGIKQLLTCWFQFEHLKVIIVDTLISVWAVYSNCKCWFQFEQFTCWFQFEQFTVSEVQTAFGFDGLVSSHPIYAPVYNPAEINEIFDTISYSKVNKEMKCLWKKYGFRNVIFSYYLYGEK